MRYLLYLLSLLLTFISYTNISDSLVFQLLPFLFLNAVFFNEFLLTKRKIKFFQKNKIILPLFILVIIIGVLLSKKPDANIYFKVFKAISLPLVVFSVYRTIFNKQKEGFLKTFLKYIFIPFVLYVTLNFLFFLAGYTGDDSIDSEAILFSYIGISATRVKFFLSVGVNAYGTVLGILLTLSLVGFLTAKRFKKYFLFGIILASISLFFTDSRGPILYAMLIAFLVRFYFSKTNKPRFLNVIPLIGFFGPFLLLSFLSVLSTTSYGETLSRSSADLASGNSRLTIWSIAITDFLQFKLDKHVFGYGEFGHYASGLSPFWGDIFDNQEVSDFVHPHNTFLSILFDYGYFGLIMYILFQYKIIRFLKQNWLCNREMSLILLANLLYFNLVGIGETMFGYYYKNVMYLFFIINIFAFIFNSNTTNLKKHS